MNIEVLKKQNEIILEMGNALSGKMQSKEILNTFLNSEPGHLARSYGKVYYNEIIDTRQFDHF